MSPTIESSLIFVTVPQSRSISPPSFLICAQSESAASLLGVEGVVLGDAVAVELPLGGVGVVGVFAVGPLTTSPSRNF